jgi:uncharacterized membrane protein YfcA
VDQTEVSLLAVGLLDRPWTLLLLFAASLIAGALNVVAGGGSFLTLPILIFLGLPAGIANATNRVGVLLQNLTAVWSFDRDGVLDRQALLWAALPSTVGSALGTWLATRISDDGFEKILAAAMILITLLSFWKPPQKFANGESRARTVFLTASFFVIGIYGGFLQAGVGFLTLAATSLAAIDLVRGNAVKVLSALCYTTLSVAIFAWMGMIHWPTGLALAIGYALGGVFGARLTVKKGHGWLKVVVTVTVILFALKLLFS